MILQQSIARLYKKTVWNTSTDRLTGSRDYWPEDYNLKYYGNNKVNEIVRYLGAEQKGVKEWTNNST